jgi:hypothetical protein
LVKVEKIDVPDPLGSALHALLDPLGSALHALLDPLGSALHALLYPEPDPVAIKTTKIYFKNLNQTFQTGFCSHQECFICYNILPIYEKAEIKF